MQVSANDANQLRTLIGEQVIHNGIPCRVVEFLEGETTLVLQDIQNTAIQANQFGDAHRHAPQTFTIPVLTREGDYHPAYLALGLFRKQ